MLPSLGEITPGSSKKRIDEEKKKKFDFPAELLFELAREGDQHIRYTIVDAGREELPSELQQFTELLNAANTLTSMTEQGQQTAQTTDMMKSILQILGYIGKNPDIRDWVIGMLKSGVKKSPPPSSQQGNQL